MPETDDRQKVLCGSAIEGNWTSGDRFAQKTVQTRASILVKIWLGDSIAGLDSSRQFSGLVLQGHRFGHALWPR
jgi:hypothetical protein